MSMGGWRKSTEISGSHSFRSGIARDGAHRQSASLDASSEALWSLEQTSLQVEIASRHRLSDLSKARTLSNLIGPVLLAMAM